MTNQLRDSRPYPMCDFLSKEIHRDVRLLSEGKASASMRDALRMANKDFSRFQPCGCVVCVCEDDYQCQGCGAKNCGTHPVGETPNPVFENDH